MEICFIFYSLAYLLVLVFMAKFFHKQINLPRTSSFTNFTTFDNLEK